MRLREKGIRYLLWCAELCYSPVEHVEVVKEVDRCPSTTAHSSITTRTVHTVCAERTRTMDRQPFIQILALGELHRETKVA